MYFALVTLFCLFSQTYAFSRNLTEVFLMTINHQRKEKAAGSYRHFTELILPNTSVMSL